MLFIPFALSIGAVGVASGLPGPRNSCREIQIPVSVSVPRYIINATVEDDWDAASLTFNLTRRDSATDAILVAGSTSASVNSIYTVGGTICGTGQSMLVLTHGIIESKLCVARRDWGFYKQQTDQMIDIGVPTSRTPRSTASSMPP
jgi:hypothetical protein